MSKAKPKPRAARGLSNKEISDSIDVLYQNQEALNGMGKELDDRFAVMFRVAIQTLNELRKKMDLEEISPSVLEKEYKAWSLFKSHPEWRKYSPAWYMAQDVSSILEEARELAAVSQLKGDSEEGTPIH